MKLRLRPYQAQAIPEARKALRKDKRALVVLATALGKTITSALIWFGFKSGPGLFLVHTTGILDHAMKEYRKVYGKRAKLVLFDSPEVDITGADIVFSTFQMMRNHKERFKRRHFKWMTVDETHHARAVTYLGVIEYFECPKLGITATPDRADLLDIREVFGNEVINVSLEEAIAKRWLPEIEYHVMSDDGFDEEALAQITKEVVEEGKRPSLEEINRRIFIRARDRQIARIIEGYEEKTLIFCRSIAHVTTFQPFLKNAEPYHSKQSRDANRGVLERFREGEIRRVLSVNAFNEGIDVPDAGLVVFLRSTDSEIIFKQQLGRGMRPTKKKLIVLDFVGNVERILMLKQMVETIERISAGKGGRLRKQRLDVSGAGFKFDFSDRLVDLMAVLERVDVEFYPTWQMASESAVRLGFTKMKEYVDGFRQDPRLPSMLRQVYKDYPGDPIFFGRVKKTLYKTWPEASRAAVALGIKSAMDYREKRKVDPGLPAVPEYYKGFPGWDEYLGKEKRDSYPTLAEAKQAVRTLKIKTSSEYFKRYKEDSRLHAMPSKRYAKEWKGWTDFCGSRGRGNKSSLYETLAEASTAAKRLGIVDSRDYRARRKEDPGLPSKPEQAYSDEWKSEKWNWHKFLGR